jgi:uncharacterized membrane protein
MVDDLTAFRGLFLAALAWLLLHRAFATGSGLRASLVERLGERGFRGLFAALSAVSLLWLVLAFRGSPCSPLWTPPRALLWLPSVVMPLAFLLLAGAFLGPRGVMPITRHPFLWSVALWSGVHLIINGNVAAALFFGSLLAAALFRARDRDRVHAERDPSSFARLAERTSNVPFAAIASGRNRLKLKELVLVGILAAALTLLVMGFHRELFHVSPFPRI